MIVFEIAPERDRPRDERLNRRHHADVAVHRQRAPAGAATRVGAIEDRQVLGFEMGGTFQGHSTAAIGVGGVDLGPGKAECGQQIETRIVQHARRDPQAFKAEFFTERPFVEREFNVESRGERRLGRAECGVVEPLRPQRHVVDLGRTRERPVAERIALDRRDFGGVIAERRQRLRNGPVDDLEIAAAGELLEFDEREIGLDPGRVAIHHQPDRAGRRQHRRLGIAETVLLTERQCPVPAAVGRRGEFRVRAIRHIERRGADRQ